MSEAILEAILHKKKELAQQMKADQKQECQEQKQRQWPGRKTRLGLPGGDGHGELTPCPLLARGCLGESLR